MFVKEVINRPMIGQGVYTIPDVASILKLPQPKVRRWINQYWDTRYAPDGIRYSWGEGRSRATSFLAMIEFYVFYVLRESGVKPLKIHHAHQIIGMVMKTAYPFASATILTDGGSVLFEPDRGNIANADKTLQLNFQEIIEPFYKKIEFGKDQHASKFFPLGPDRSVEVDPMRKFGQPVIKGTNIPAEIILSYFLAEKSVNQVARIFSLKKHEVEDAIEFCNLKSYDHIH